MKRNILLLGLLVLAAGVAYVWFFIYNKKHADVEESNADYKYWYGDFRKEVLENREAAQKKFFGIGKDIITEISGVVKTVEKGDSISTVLFGTETDAAKFDVGVEVMAKFNKDAAALKAGDSVRMKAVYSGVDDPIDEMGITEPGRVKLKRGTLNKINK